MKTSHDVQVAEKNWQFLCHHNNVRTILLYGGAGSAKSWSIAQYLLFEKFYKMRNLGILVVRHTMPALRSSAYKLLLNQLRKYDLPHKHNKSEGIIYNEDMNNFIIFRGLDDVEKVKSIEGINYVWMEEATEVNRFDYIQLQLRARAENINPGAINQLFVSFNPIDPQSFLKPMTENPPPNTAVCHSTYRDNPFLPAEERAVIDALVEYDITYDAIYNKGLWASPGNVVYTNWKVTTGWPNHPDSVGYGLDFGYNAPSALIEIAIKDYTVYERQRLYKTKLTNSDLIAELQEIIPPRYRNRVIVADCAEPDRIEEIFKAGFNVHPAVKGKNSVKDGIDKVKRLDIRVHCDSKDVLEEKRSYKWKMDKEGNTLDDVVPHKDHLMDAERYYLQTVDFTPVTFGEIGSYDLDMYSDPYEALTEMFA